jgi:hypothetical protein
MSEQVWWYIVGAVGVVFSVVMAWLLAPLENRRFDDARRDRECKCKTVTVGLTDLEVGPDDQVIIEYPQVLSPADAEYIAATWKRAMDESKSPVILSGGGRVVVLRGIRQPRPVDEPAP